MDQHLKIRATRRQVLTGAAAGATVAVSAKRSSAFAVPTLQGETTLEYWHPPHSADPDAERGLLESQIEQFQTENAGIRVNLTLVPWADVYQKWTTAIAAGAPPDISISGSEAAIQFAAEGHLLPVSDIVEGIGGAEAHWETLPFFAYDGDYWQVPYIDGAWVFFTNPAMLQELGIETNPATWDEVFEAAHLAAEQGQVGLPLSFAKNYTPNQAHLCMQSADGVGSLTPEGQVAMETPEMMAVTESYVRFYRDNLVPPDALSWTGNDEALAFLTNGLSPMAVGYGSRAQKVIDDAAANNIEIAIANMPMGSGGRPGSYGATNGHMIFSEAKNPVAAAVFIDFLHREENLIPWSLLTGWLAPTRSAAASPELDTPGLNAMRSQLEAGAVVRNGYAFGGHPANGQVEGSLIFPEMIQEIVVGGSSVEEAHAHYQVILEELYGQTQ